MPSTQTTKNKTTAKKQQLKKSTLQLESDKSKSKKRRNLTVDKSNKNIRYWVYCLSNTTHSYVGKTNNLTRRLRQHRGEIAGGARYTKIHNNPNRPWRYAWILNAPNESDALKIECALHRNSKGRARGTGIPCQRRLNGLINLIAKTTAATKAATPWNKMMPLTIVCNSEEITLTQIETLQAEPMLFRVFVK